MVLILFTVIYFSTAVLLYLHAFYIRLLKLEHNVLINYAVYHMPNAVWDSGTENPLVVVFFKCISYRSTMLYCEAIMRVYYIICIQNL